MGATTFFTTAQGKTAADAFHNAKEKAFYDYGHRGYTGTIAEKPSFCMIEMPPEEEHIKTPTPEEYAQQLIDEADPRIDDPWEDAGCIQIDDETFLFFGWAKQ